MKIILFTVQCFCVSILHNIVQLLNIQILQTVFSLQCAFSMFTYANVYTIVNNWSKWRAHNYLKFHTIALGVSRFVMLIKFLVRNWDIKFYRISGYLRSIARRNLKKFCSYFWLLWKSIYWKNKMKFRKRDPQFGTFILAFMMLKFIHVTSLSFTQM